MGNNNMQGIPNGCMGCMAYTQQEPFDCNELNVFKDNKKPRGKITQNSSAYLTVDEIKFFRAVSGRNVSLIRFYLNKGININLLDEERTSPLHVAARYGSLQVIQEVIQSGADLNITDMQGWTPLHVATFFQRSQVCKILLQAGAFATIKNREGLYPVDFVKDNKTQEIFKEHQICQEQGSKLEDLDRYREQYMKQIRQNENARDQYDCYLTNFKNKIGKVNGSPFINFKYQSNNNNLSILPVEREDSFRNNSRLKENNELSDSININFKLIGEDNSISSELQFISLRNLVKIQYNKGSDESLEVDFNFSEFCTNSPFAQQLGRELFVINYLLGLSYLILTGQVLPNPEQVALYLLKYCQISKTKHQITNLLSSIKLQGSGDILDSFIQHMQLKLTDFVTTLREFFLRLICESDPIIIDILVQGLSRHFFQQFKSKPFMTEGSFHMFTFATLVLDIDLNQNEIKDNKEKFEQCIQDFMSNIQEINEGNNFNQIFVNYVIDELRRKKIVHIIDNPRKQSFETLRKLLSQSETNSFKVSKKKKNNIVNILFKFKFKIVHYDFIIKEKMIFFLNENRMKIIAMEQCNIQIDKKKELSIKPMSQTLQIAVSKNFETFVIIEKKQKICFKLLNSLDIPQIQQLV